MARILLVEDDQLLRDGLTTSLSDAGYDVSACANGAEGLHLFSRDGANLVVTDIVMPETDGIEIVRGIRSLDDVTPIIAMSGNEKYLEAAHVFGSSRILLKPFRVRQLLDLIREELDR